MSEKNIYTAFDNIIIDEHEFDNVNVQMSSVQKRQLKTNLRRNIMKRRFIKSKIIAACAAFLIFVAGISYVNPAVAAQIPILNPIVQMLGYRGDYAKYSDIVNKTVAYNGKSFTINSVVCFDNNLIIGYTAKSNTKIDSTGPLFFPTFKVNGKWLNVGFSGGQENLDNNTAIGTIEIMSDLTLPDKFNFEMSFNAMDNTSGNWDFKFVIAKVLSKDIKVYNPNQVVKYGNYDFTIGQITLTPFGTVISQHSSSESKMPFFPIILDEQGTEISKGGGSVKESSDRFDITSILSKINKDAKSLTIVPYSENGNGEAKVVSVPLNTKLPVELPQGKIGKITINKISFSNDNDQVRIEGIMYGKLPDFRARGLALVGDNPKANIAVLNTTIKKIGTDKYEIIRDISGLKNDKNYKLTAPNLDNTLDYDSRITVMLK